MDNIPENPMQLLSFVNMKLRDYYPNLEMLCDDLMIDKEELLKKLGDAGYEYNESVNKFW